MKIIKKVAFDLRKGVLTNIGLHLGLVWREERTEWTTRMAFLWVLWLQVPTQFLVAFYSSLALPSHLGFFIVVEARTRLESKSESHLLCSACPKKCAVGALPTTFVWLLIFSSLKREIRLEGIGDDTRIKWVSACTSRDIGASRLVKHDCS